MGKMLINATQAEEVRVALIENDQLFDLDIECPSEIKKKGCIYKAIVTRCEPSLNAFFVDCGLKKQGFLPFSEVSPEYFHPSFQNATEENVSVAQAIKVGQELLIQIDKEERGNKGAAVTTYIAVAGHYLVLMPNNPRSGISRRIEGDERDELRETLQALNLSKDMGLIIRTAGVGKSHDELQNDLDMLLNQWQAIQQAYNRQLAPCLIHQEGDVIIRSIRDNLRKSVSEIIIDDQVSFIKAKQYIEQVKPEFLPYLKLYNSNIPLFSAYQIESQIEIAYQREVLLPSGGALVIDRTEALVSIDINSAKATGGQDIETTALNTNLEAAQEIARQLRLRDLGGLIVIDFIDMSLSKNQREVENRLKEALEADRARIQVGRISRFGLLEMSRQRRRLSLGETSQDICPRCEGRGTVRNIQSHALSLVRLIEEEALKAKTSEVQVQLPVDMATFLMNEKREFILIIEKRHKVKVVIISNPYLQMPKYNIIRIKEDSPKNKQLSYDLIQQPEINLVNSSPIIASSEPAVKAFNVTINKSSQSFMKRIFSYIFGPNEIIAAEKRTLVNEENNKRPIDSKRPINRRRRPSNQRSHYPRKRSNSPQNTRSSSVKSDTSVGRKKETEKPDNI